MKVLNFLATAALMGAACTLEACAVLPFAPTIAHVVPRMLFPNYQPGQQVAQVDQKPDTPDPALEHAITAPPSAQGDTGLQIDQQDRVAFAPAAQGSIPLRVAAADLVSDLKARSVGDIVTVNVVESVNTESKAETTLANKRSINSTLPNLLMAAETLAKRNPLLNLNSLVSGTSDNATAGSGDMTADDAFSATVSAVVTAVNPSGTLTIKGDRSLRVNGEDDTIHLSGVVRPQDIDSNNMVSSMQVADLHVSITGEGQIRDKQGDGIGTRLFDWLWLF